MDLLIEEVSEYKLRIDMPNIMTITFDPFDMLMTLNARMQLAENHIQQIQRNQLEISKMLNDQADILKQLSHTNNLLAQRIQIYEEILRNQ